MENNIGRAAIRNLFLKYANFNYLLFLDCDTRINNKQFINNYLSSLKNNPLVICGGRSYSKKPIRTKHRLRWKYGVYRECKTAVERNRNPWHSFMTNNFIVKKTVLGKINFDEHLKAYGHEDTLFGYQLMTHKIQIQHIDNETIHDFNESSWVFLKKTRQGLKNLYFINTKLFPNGNFCQMNKLLQSFSKIKKAGLNLPMALISYVLLKPIALLFCLGIVWLWCFDIYKLLYFCRISVFKPIKQD